MPPITETLRRYFSWRDPPVKPNARPAFLLFDVEVQIIALDLPHRTMVLLCYVKRLKRSLERDSRE
jgi:hypothetical protein